MERGFGTERVGTLKGAETLEQVWGFSQAVSGSWSPSSGFQEVGASCGT